MNDISRFSMPREILLVEEHKSSFGAPIVEEGPGLRDYWQVIKKRRWIIAIFFFGVVISTAIFIFTRTPIYTAKATIMIEGKDPQVVNIQHVLTDYVGSSDYDYYQSQYQILKSRRLAALVIQEQGLDKNSAFTGEETERSRVNRQLAAWVFQPIAELLANATAWVNGQKSPSQDSRQVPKADGGDSLGVDPSLIDTYEGMLGVEPLKGTRLAKIAFSTPDPVLSATAANAHAEAYIRQGVKLRTQANREAQGFLEVKLGELKERVESSEAALNSFRRKKGILALNEKENIVVERLADLNRRLTEAEAERIGLEAHARLIKQRGYDSLPAVLSHGLIQNLKGQLVNLEAQYAQLETQYKLGYPPLAKLKAQIDETRQRLSDQIKIVVEGINSAYFAAAGKEKALRLEMEKQKADTLALKDASVEYAILAREVDTNKQLYDSVLGRMKEIGVAAEVRASNVSIIDPAEVPRQPSWPKKKLNFLLGALMGLIGGLGLAFLWEFLDNTLKTPEEAERYLRLPNLAVVPDLFSLPNPRRNRQLRISHQVAALNAKLCIPGKTQVSGPPLSVMSDAYRKLRTSILLSRPGNPPRTILFTSGTKGEGKTITTANTAIMFAQMGYQVLIVDADLRRPSCEKALRVRRSARGLTDFLAGQEELEKTIKPTSMPNLYLVGSGSVPPNPTELVGSKRMYETLALLKNRFDFVLIDSPPVMPLSDAVILSTMVEAVVLVVRGQQTEKHLVKMAVSELGNGHGKILGVVFNGVDIPADYADYYYYTDVHARGTGTET